MTNREKFLTGDSFMYKGRLYRYSKEWIFVYTGGFWHSYAACDPKGETAAFCVVHVFDVPVTASIGYDDLSFGR